MINQEKYAEQKALAHKASTLSNIESLLTTYATSKNTTTIKKCDSLCYWLDTYIKYLLNEDDFDSKKLKSYERGDIIKVNLGYNIGDEEGGLHYCAVLDNKNDLSSDVITVIPLSSYKGKTIHRKSVFLGTTLYDLMYKNGINTPVEYIYYMDGIFKGQLYFEFSSIMERLFVDATEEKIMSSNEAKQDEIIKATLAIIRDSYFKEKGELSFDYVGGNINYNFEEVANQYEENINDLKNNK